MSLRRHAVAIALTNLFVCAGTAYAQFPLEYRTIDGSGNNIAHPLRGATGTELMRMTTIDYADGIGMPSGPTRASAREISNAVCAQVSTAPNARSASDMIWQWGQFVDHDIDLTEGANPGEDFSIPVPMGDPWFDPLNTGTASIGLSRSVYVMSGVPAVRQQVNQITSFLDGSMVYGSDAIRAAALRANDGSGKLVTTAGDLLPFNTLGLHNAPTSADPSMFLAGDVRANEQNGLTAMHTLFVREHNHWAEFFGTMAPFMTDEDRYQAARAIVTAEIQRITFEEWLPVLIGDGVISPYTGYDASVDATIANEFSTAAFRLGHSLLSPNLKRLDDRLETIGSGDLPLRNAFFNPAEITAHGIDCILRGLVRQEAQEIDTQIVDDVRNFLFGPPGAGGFDLASLNIQRGRDHGLPCYNQVRADYGLPTKATFADVTSDPTLQAQLASVYANVDEIDAWVGGLAEDKMPGAMVGELIQTVLKDQFERLRDGDRFWYEHYLPSVMQQLLVGQTLATIIRRNTDIGDEIQDDVFLVGGAVAHVGDSCGAAGTMTAIGGKFERGNPTFGLRLEGASPAATTAVVSFSDLPTPNLVACGSCEVLMPTFVSWPISVVGGQATQPWPQAVDSAALGMKIHAQFLVNTPGNSPCIPGADVSASNRVVLFGGP